MLGDHTLLGSSDLSGQEVHGWDHTLLGSADLSGHEVHARGPHAAGFC